MFGELSQKYCINLIHSSFQVYQLFFSQQIYNFTLYADDTSAVIKRITVQSLQHDVTKTTIDEIRAWFLNNDLLLNEEKTRRREGR